MAGDRDSFRNSAAENDGHENAGHETRSEAAKVWAWIDCQDWVDLIRIGSIIKPVTSPRVHWRFRRVGGTTGSASYQQSTNNRIRKVAGSRPTKVVCITVLTGNRMGWTARCGRPPLLLPSCRKLEFRLSALIPLWTRICILARV